MIPQTFQELILRLQSFWADHGCVVLQPLDMEVGAGTFHPATFLRAVGPENWNAAYVQPSRRPTDGRYGENPNRLQHYYQFQVVMKPSPANFQELYLESLKALGVDTLEHDVRFVEDNWESPTLGAWGLGWEVWLNGMEVSQFTYFQQAGGIECFPVTGEITYVQKAKYLPKIASAEYVAAYALTEPNAGSDANAGKTKATLNEDGTHYLLNGQKIWITNGGFADVYVVFAKIDDDKNLSAFIVERTFEGFSTGAEEKKFGIKGSSTVAIFFDNCKVPVENLLGERQGGFKMALTILNGGRIKAGAGATGGALHALELGIDYAKTRQQFGKAISEFGVIQAKLGDIATQVFATEAAVFRTADLIDNKIEELVAKGIAANEAKVKAVREFAIEAAIIKVRGSELACHALDEVMQIHGGMGYAFETGIGMGYRDARITKIYEGTNEINSMLAVGELFKRAMQTKEVDLKTVGGKIPSFLVSRINPFRDKSDKTEQERIVKGLKYAFLYVSNIAGKKLKEELINEQEIVMNLSTILQESFLSESAWLKVEKLSQLSNGKDLELQRQQLRLYLYLSLAKAKAAAKEAVASIESGRKQRQHNRIIDLLLQPYLINPKEVRRSIAKTILK